MAFSLRSASFEHEAAIPAKHTCQGVDTAPPLAWSDAPAGAASFALIVDDPDAPDPRAPKTTWVHWVLYNLAAATSALPEGAKTADLPAETLEGVNDFGTTGYRGPCPPIGRHRYFFKLYALDVHTLGLPPGVKRPELLKAIQGHILAETQYLGRFERK